MPDGRRELGSWLEGPPRLHPETYPGERLGLPETGRGSMASFGVRLAAVLIDFAAVYVLCLIAVPRPGHQSFNIIEDVVFVLLTAGSLTLTGRTPGMFALGLQVVRLDGGRLGWRSLPRQLLLALLVPALIWNRDRRGLHDRAVGTAVVHLK